MTSENKQFTVFCFCFYINSVQYINSVTDKINKETKFCTIQGDFNLDLLKIDSYPTTDDFINILGSNFFQPYILQPTRITDHSATDPK